MRRIFFGGLFVFGIIGYNVAEEPPVPAPVPAPVDNPPVKVDADKEKKDKEEKEAKLKEQVKKLEEKVKKLEKKLKDKKVPEAVFTQLATWGNPGAGYANFGVKVGPNGLPSVVAQRYGTAILNSDGFIGFLGNIDGSQVILCPPGSFGFGSKVDNHLVLFFPYENGNFSEPYMVDPVASAGYAGFWEYHHAADPTTGGYMVILK